MIRQITLQTAGRKRRALIDKPVEEDVKFWDSVYAGKIYKEFLAAIFFKKGICYFNQTKIILISLIKRNDEIVNLVFWVSKQKMLLIVVEQHKNLLFYSK